MFSGLGGWTRAAKAMGLEPVLRIDSDGQVAKASPKRLGVECVTAKQYVELCLHNQQNAQHVVNDDARNPDTWVTIGLANDGQCTCHARKPSMPSMEQCRDGPGSPK